jgi:hypothetical protein
LMSSPVERRRGCRGTAQEDLSLRNSRSSYKNISKGCNPKINCLYEIRLDSFWEIISSFINKIKSDNPIRSQHTQSMLPNQRSLKNHHCWWCTNKNLTRNSFRL